MSHIHNIAGQSNAAAEYQAYLEALKAARQARENDEAQADGAVRTFDSAIDADMEGEQPEEESTEEEGVLDHPVDEAATEPGDTPPEGLGKWYA